MLPPPRDVAAAPRILVAELAERIGEDATAGVCESLLSGGDPRDFETELTYLGGRPAVGVLNGTWQPYWARVWGARGLLYAWTPAAAPAVVAGLGDSAWRVAEMCLKVAAHREVAEAADSATTLLSHPLPRVRAQAARTLGVVGDSEHADAVRAALDDPEPAVRRAAELACRRLDVRLDRV